MGVSFELKKLAHLVEHLKYDISNVRCSVSRLIGVHLPVSRPFSGF